jgi:hypothetical protein
MNTGTLVLILQVVAGAAILLMGRRLFWLFVAVTGFLASFDVVPLLLPGRPEWVTLLLAVVAGGVGALLAVGLQYVAAAIVGFVGGSYGSVPLVMLLLGHGASWVPFLGGIVGAVLMVVLFDWTLIVLSALAGARALVTAFGLEGTSGVVAWLVLAAVGIAFQASALAPATPPVRGGGSAS